MTPAEKVMWLIVKNVADWSTEFEAPDYPCDNIHEVYYALQEEMEEKGSGSFYDSREEVRCSGEPTGLSCEWDRHFDSESVAKELPDGSWVGWTYWYGGGKYAEPGAIPWVGNAYNVDCVEEEKLVKVKTFMKW